MAHSWTKGRRNEAARRRPSTTTDLESIPLLRKAEGLAWRNKPSWSIVAAKDRTVNPELELFAARRMYARATEIDSSHVPMLSHPVIVLDVIREAASSR
jgi:pimeloyl-ACP methyl ester carboxylesterase